MTARIDNKGSAEERKMLTKASIVITVGVAVLSIGLNANAQQELRAWSVGQEWSLRLRQYGRAQMVSSLRDNEKNLVPRVQREFHVRARVTELTRREGRECVQIKFTAESDAPDFPSTNPPDTEYLRTLEYTLTLDARSGSVVELKPRGEAGVNEQVLQAEGYAAVLPGAGFPVDWILARSDLDDPVERTMLLHFPGFRPAPDRPTPNTALRRAISPAAQDGSVRITVGHVGLNASGEPHEEARCEVEQVWRPNELWWRSFRRYIGGLIDMEAVLLTDPGGSNKPIEMPAPRPIARPSLPAGATWKVGQEWRFLVKESGGDPALPEKVRFEYHMKARVTELVKEEGGECARIEFTAENDAPGMYTALFALVVDAQTWSPVRFEYPKKHGGLRPAAEAESYRALLPTMPGVPLDWVVLRSDLGNVSAREEFLHFPGLKSVKLFGLRRAISSPEKNGTLRITVGLWVPRQNPADATETALCEVEQVWQPGELWWRSFKRWSHGRLELEATRVSVGVQP